MVEDPGGAGGKGDGGLFGKMMEDGVSGNREESGEGVRPGWKRGQPVWEFQREREPVCSKGRNYQADRKRADSLTD